MTKSEQKLTPVEEHILSVMKALDHQIDREVQRRRPDQLESLGVQKWSALKNRVELLSSFAIARFGNQEVGFDSILVLGEAFILALQIVTEELGAEGLGDVRTTYAVETLKRIKRCSERALDAIEQQDKLN